MSGWVWERDPADARLAAGRFAADGLRVVAMTQPQSGNLRQTQAAIAAALRLPSPAERNLDAFADTLSDLRVWWGGEAVALLWEDAGRLREVDPRAWRLLTTILDDAQVPVVAVVAREEQV